MGFDLGGTFEKLNPTSDKSAFGKFSPLSPKGFKYLGDIFSPNRAGGKSERAWGTMAAGAFTFGLAAQGLQQDAQKKAKKKYDEENAAAQRAYDAEEAAWLAGQDNATGGDLQTGPAGQAAWDQINPALTPAGGADPWNDGYWGSSAPRA